MRANQLDESLRYANCPCSPQSYCQNENVVTSAMWVRDLLSGLASRHTQGDSQDDDNRNHGAWWVALFFLTTYYDRSWPSFRSKTCLTDTSRRLLNLTRTYLGFTWVFSCLRTVAGVWIVNESSRRTLEVLLRRLLFLTSSLVFGPISNYTCMYRMRCPRTLFYFTHHYLVFTLIRPFFMFDSLVMITPQRASPQRNSPSHFQFTLTCHFHTRVHRFPDLPVVVIH